MSGGQYHQLQFVGGMYLGLGDCGPGPFRSHVLEIHYLNQLNSARLVRQVIVGVQDCAQREKLEAAKKTLNDRLQEAEVDLRSMRQSRGNRTFGAD
ncbi:hypothetical protein LP417_31005 [Polaromonas sp. P1-6]|nr:hypothetical protein LP417_31005 [Polaromonas sp. P1-6]